MYDKLVAKVCIVQSHDKVGRALRQKCIFRFAFVLEKLVFRVSFQNISHNLAILNLKNWTPYMSVLEDKVLVILADVARFPPVIVR